VPENRCAIGAEQLPYPHGRSSSHRRESGVATKPSTIFTAGERPQPVGRDEGKTSLSESRPAPRRLNLVPVNSNLRAVTEGDRAWVSKGLCRTADPDELFVRGAAQRQAAVICRHCPVMQQCAADALDNQVEYGVWGGLTERQRRALLKEHPDVVSWSEFLEKRNNRSIG
jgi:WhiB family transcriptional regulator, redox-sensing transcriptional regulator